MVTVDEMTDEIRARKDEIRAKKVELKKKKYEINVQQGEELYGAYDQLPSKKKAVFDVLFQGGFMLPLAAVYTKANIDVVVEPFIESCNSGDIETMVFTGSAGLFTSAMNLGLAYMPAKKLVIEPGLKLYDKLCEWSSKIGSEGGYF